MALRCAADLARREAAIDYEQNLSAGERPAAAPFGAEAADSAALLAEGKRLLVGRGAPFEPQRGAALIREAAGLGNADALCLAATLFGAGAWAPQSWPDALDLLVLAAERGSADAREQITIMAERRDHDGRPAPAGHWRALRRRIDLEAFVQPTPRVEISQSPRVWTARGFADAATCRYLVRRAQGKLKPAQMYNRRTREQSYDAMRTNSDYIVDIAESGVVLLLLRIRMSLLASLPVPHMEPPQVLHYLPGQELKAHYDFIGDEGARVNDRAATVLIALNDDYDGGETAFLRTGLRWRGKTGDALFFANITGGQPDKMSLHAGKPLARGEKYLLSQWIRSAPYAI